MKSKVIRRAYKFRLVPTVKQEQLLRQCGGNARFVWNTFLRMNEEEYAKNKKFIFGYDLIVLQYVVKIEGGKYIVSLLAGLSDDSIEGDN